MMALAGVEPETLVSQPDAFCFSAAPSIFFTKTNYSVTSRFIAFYKTTFYDQHQSYN